MIRIEYGNIDTNMGHAHIGNLSIDTSDGDEDSKRLFDLLWEIVRKQLDRSDAITIAPSNSDD